MAKVVDITDRLSFEEKPKMVIKGEEYEINDDAVTVLKIMGMQEDFENNLQQVYELIFSEKERERLEKLKLNFTNFTEVLTTAMTLASGGEDEEPRE